MIPFGILEVKSGQLNVVYGVSYETSDFIVDCLESWWFSKDTTFQHIKKLVINLDNGPQCSSARTQFIKRIVEFSDQNNIEIHLVYYPPYHSKYNPIERCWGVLESHWNGTLLDSALKVMNWTKTMTWKGINPVVKLIEDVYEKGVKLTKKAFGVFEKRLLRDEQLPKYSVIIQPRQSG